MLATLVAADGSASFDAGAFMLIGEDGTLEGSVTGGCIESDLAGQAFNMLDQRSGPRMESYGVTDEQAHRAGLT